MVEKVVVAGEAEAVEAEGIPTAMVAKKRLYRIRQVLISLALRVAGAHQRELQRVGYYLVCRVHEGVYLPDG